MAHTSTSARVGAHSLHASHDSREVTRKARKRFLETFELAVDPDGTLPAQERARRARHALKAHMNRLALRSAEVRRERRQAETEEGGAA